MDHSLLFDTPGWKAQSILRQAILDNSLAGVQFALEHGADPLLPASLDADARKASPFDLCSAPLPAAALNLALQKRCSLPIIELLGPLSRVDYPDLSGTTSLMLAASRSMPDALAALLPLSKMDAIDRSGCDALMRAVDFSIHNDQPIADTEKCVQLLLAAGAPADRRDCWGRTALLRSVLLDSANVLQLLIPHSDTSERDALGRSALVMAAAYKNSEAAIALLGVVDPLIRPPDGRDAAFWAARWPLGSFLSLLIKQCPAVLDRPPGEPTLLMIAAGAQCLENVQTLIPVSDPKAVGIDGADALMIAIEQAPPSGLSECALLLLPLSDLSLVDILGESALEKARMRGFDELAQAIEDRIQDLALSDPPLVRARPHF